MSDGLGSVRGWLNGSQVFVSDVDYNPYGVPSGAVDDFGFTGEMTDSNGLVYLRARYYDPNIGNFVSLDPFEGFDGSPMSLNGYSWVEGNPINRTDPSGMYWENVTERCNEECLGDPCMYNPYDVIGYDTNGRAILGNHDLTTCRNISSGRDIQVTKCLMACHRYHSGETSGVFTSGDELLYAIRAVSEGCFSSIGAIATVIARNPGLAVGGAGVGIGVGAGLTIGAIYGLGLGLVLGLLGLSAGDLTRTQPRVRRKDDNPEDCDEMKHRDTRAEEYARVARWFYNSLSDEMDVNRGALPVTLAFTRVRDGSGKCQSIGAISNIPQGGLDMNNVADSVFSQLYDVFVRGEFSTPQYGQGHAETNLYNYVVSIGGRNSLKAIGISNPQGPCGSNGVNCRTFFTTEDIQVGWLLTERRGEELQLLLP